MGLPVVDGGCVWLAMVLYSRAGIAALCGYAAKKGKHNGLCDVTSIVVTEVPIWRRGYAAAIPSAIYTMAKASIRGGDLIHHAV